MAGSGAAPQLRIGFSEAWSALPTRLTRPRRPCQHAVLYLASPARLLRPARQQSEAASHADRESRGPGRRRLWAGATRTGANHALVTVRRREHLLRRRRHLPHRRTSPRVAGPHPPASPRTMKRCILALDRPAPASRPPHARPAGPRHEQGRPGARASRGAATPKGGYAAPARPARFSCSPLLARVSGPPMHVAARCLRRYAGPPWGHMCRRSRPALRAAPAHRPALRETRRRRRRRRRTWGWKRRRTSAM